MGQLEGKVALVTGAGSGIGHETARLLAREGARVALVGRRRDALEDVRAEIGKDGGAAEVFPVDLAEENAAGSVVDDVIARLGGVDIVVHNAGMASRIPNVRWTTCAEWQSVMDVNMTAVFLLTQRALPRMLAQGGGSIIVVSSLAAVRPNLLGGAAYGAAKAAARNFVAYLHNTFRNDGIRATCIMPGETATPIMDSRVRPPTAEERDGMMQPEDVARAVLLCCTLPGRTVIEEIAIAPTRQRDISGDLEAARRHGAPGGLE
ncbi:SDR family oxidoreductase [Gluconacetobacter asukensis]|uniref:SDR family oxidoreductase n=1 Tax=Gluconacetobacter asukensis TaxID=1017181 RepID=A0A7W4IZG0_9PROT|nr:SDR family oxidoreductase [Gluconacetobacter asukensis]MBB2171859.1 SDR family oxidoreductase [Gluconacetobacter asukensis]